MAEAGINPQARIDFMERLYLEEELVLNGREPMPEFLSTHPSVSEPSGKIRALELTLIEE